jgi:hypothetical protein
MRETQGRPIPLFISGVTLGVGLGLLGSRVLQGWQGRRERQRAMDQLTGHFHALFREIDAGNNSYQ